MHCTCAQCPTFTLREAGRKRPWDAADDLHTNSKLKSSEYSIPVLGLIFLRYADYRFEQAEKDLSGRSTRRRAISKADYQAHGVLNLRDASRLY